MSRNTSPNLSYELGPKEDIRGRKRDFEEEVDSDDSSPKNEKRSGRRKIKIEYIDDKNRRHITFSKRKAGIMKKAYELSTLTGTQVLLLVVSETGLVYTFTTPKLQPLVTQPEGKNLIQSCLNAPDTNLAKESMGSSAQQTQNSTPQPQGPVVKQIPSPSLKAQRQQLQSTHYLHGHGEQATSVYGSDGSARVDPDSEHLYGDRQSVRNMQQPQPTSYPSLASMNYGHQYSGLSGQIPSSIPMGSVGNYMNTQQYSQYNQSPMGSYVPPNNQYMAQSNYWANNEDNTNGVSKASQYSSPHTGTSK